MPDALSPATVLPARPESVRLANYGDEAAIYDLLVSLHRENMNGWGIIYRPEVVLARIETATRPDPETRSNPSDQRVGIIGVIDGPNGKLAGSVGLFIEPAMWFSDIPAMIELWVYVRKTERHLSHEADLRKFARWAHAAMKADLARKKIAYPFELYTGFQHRGPRFNAMLRLWRRWGGQLCGALFVIR